MSQGFDKEFGTLRELGEKVFVLRGSTLIVEIMPEQELKTKGGLIMSAPTDHRRGDSINAHKLEIGRVVMAGEGYWDEDTKTMLPLEAQAGAIVILPQYSTSILSMFPGINKPTANKLAMVKMGDVLAYYPSAEAFEKAQAKLN